MGKATIVSGGEEGLYTVDLDYGSEIITAQVAEIDAQIADRQADLTEAETAANDAETALNAATNDVDNAITAYTADPTDANRLAMNAAATEATRLAAEYRNAEARRQSLATIILSLQADKSQLQSVRTSETRQAWCVDYTEDATGEVATIEVPGEVGTLVIAPGGRTPTSADGRLIARGAQVSYQCYYNAAILPAWQRFIHPYRAGTLSAVDKDANTGTVDLDAATSSAAGLQVRDAETITAPIQYMDCNAAVFEENDRVIVDMSEPTIIGFESEPRECACNFPFGPTTALATPEDRYTIHCYILRAGEDMCISSAYLGTKSGTRQEIAIYRAVSATPFNDAYMPFEFGELLWSGRTDHTDGLKVWPVPRIEIATGEYIAVAAWAQVSEGSNVPYGYLAFSDYPAIPSWASEIHPAPGSTESFVDVGYGPFAPNPENSDPEFSTPGPEGLVGWQPLNGAVMRDDDDNLIPRPEITDYYRFGINRKKEDIEAGA